MSSGSLVRRRDMDLTASQRRAVLIALCVAVFTINLDSTLVNVTLPTLVRELGASTSRLQWVVDAYHLAFAALVLAAGSLSDRYGRKGALLVGLGIFGSATAVGSLATTSGQLVVARTVMGVGAAIVFPNTLSLLSNVFVDRVERAKAIGVWGATTGMGVALGPIVGGWLLGRFWWGSVFLAMAPAAVVAMVLVAVSVPPSRDPAAPRLDRVGLGLSTVTVGLLVYTVIEAPTRGWSASATFTGFAAVVALALVFLWWEQRVDQPMLDVRLFTNLRFSAASGAVTVAFFSLFGFIFLITMYFQFLRGYSPLQTGIRTLPVAASMGAASVLGTGLAVRFGNKAVISIGLAMMAIGFWWISHESLATSYLELAGQMVVTAGGMGLTSAPATEAIMGVVPKEKAAVGSAVNDATRELGGTLGVAVIGSVFSSLYVSSLRGSHGGPGVPPALLTRAQESVGAALLGAKALASRDPNAAAALTRAAQHAFFHGFEVGCMVAAGAALGGAVFAGLVLPARPIERLDVDLSPASDDDEAIDLDTAPVGAAP
jgi:EmrB/QacA subfamily drug resistance transporter